MFPCIVVSTDRPFLTRLHFQAKIYSDFVVTLAGFRKYIRNKRMKIPGESSDKNGCIDIPVKPEKDAIDASDTSIITPSSFSEEMDVSPYVTIIYACIRKRVSAKSIFIVKSVKSLKRITQFILQKQLTI